MEHRSLALRRLDGATRALHATADERWLELLRPDVTLRDYTTQLERNYGFVAPYDAALAYLPALAVHPQIRTTLLVRDLLALGKTPHHIATLPMCLEIDLESPDLALGWIYVVERSAVVHAGLLRHLAFRLPITNSSAFLGADTSCFGPVWDDLGVALDKVESLEDIIRGARDAFATQRDWFAQIADASRSYG